MNITIGTPASIATPDAGEVTLFLDSTNNNILSYKDENGDVFVYNEENGAAVAEAAACEIAKNLGEALTCAFKKGTINATEFNAAMAAGIQVLAKTDQTDGVNTTNIRILGGASMIEDPA